MRNKLNKQKKKKKKKDDDERPHLAVCQPVEVHGIARADFADQLVNVLLVLVHRHGCGLGEQAGLAAEEQGGGALHAAKGNENKNLCVRGRAKSVLIYLSNRRKMR